VESVVVQQYIEVYIVSSQEMVSPNGGPLPHPLHIRSPSLLKGNGLKYNWCKIFSGFFSAVYFGFSLVEHFGSFFFPSLSYIVRIYTLNGPGCFYTR
jgi:hypothetical protein